MNSINLVTLPRTCFAVVPMEYPCHETTLKIEKFALKNNEYNLNYIQDKVQNVEEIIKDTEKSLYVNLDVRKYLLVDAQLKSGKVQGLSCDYYIYTNQDTEDIAIMTVGDLINGLHIDDYIEDHENYNRAKDYLQQAIDFEVIEETDYVRMTYRYPGRSTWKVSREHWNTTHNHHRVNVMSVTGMVYPGNKKIIPLIDVLQYSSNNEITVEQSDKIKRLLQTRDTEKVALTILNGINPDKSFVELLCLINHMDSCIAKNNPNVPILPLLHGAYGMDTKMVRRSDNIVREYEKAYGKANDEILERIADSYWHPKNENSSVFNFKLKLKKYGI